MRLFLAVFFVFGIVSICASSASPVGAAMSPCFEKAATQTDLNRCADADARASQHRVDVAYATLQKGVTGAELHGIAIDQREWLEYRNANCKSASNIDLPAAGSMAPERNLTCIAQRNDERTAYLKWRAASPEQQQNRPMP